MDEKHEIDCDQVKTCVQRLLWDVEQLIEKERESDKRIQSIEHVVIQVKWTAIGILGTMLSYAIGLVDVVKGILLG